MKKVDESVKRPRGDEGSVQSRDGVAVVVGGRRNGEDEGVEVTVFAHLRAHTRSGLLGVVLLRTTHCIKPAETPSFL